MIAKNILWLAMGVTSLAIAGDRFEVRRPGAQRTLKVAIYGDSIASGFNRTCPICGISGGPYGEHFARNLSAALNVNIEGWNDAHMGDEARQIYAQIRKGEREVAQADYLLIDGGGNDFLQHTKRNMCAEPIFREAAAEVDEQFELISAFVAQHKKRGARASYINMYYPLVDRYRDEFCPALGRNVHDHFFAQFIEANYAIQMRARAHGIEVVDVFSRMNCTEADHNGNGILDTRECAFQWGESLESYKFRLITLYEQGVIHDISQKRDAGGTPLDLLQRDDTHPNRHGHAFIGDLIGELGF